MASQDLQSKLNRAIQAVIIDQGAGTESDTLIEFTSEPRVPPLTSIDSGGADEHVMFSGNWRFAKVMVVLNDPATVEDENPKAAQIAALQRYNLVRQALTRIGDLGEFSFMPDELTTIGRALADAGEDNADMTDFTVFWWKIVGLSSPRINPEANCFEAQLQFDCIACNGNVS